MTKRRTVLWCRRCAGLLAATVAVGCGSQARDADPDPEPAGTDDGKAVVVPDPEPVRAPELETRYYEGYLAETIDGDIDAARSAYRAIVASSRDAPADVAARAALRLAELESRVGRRREGLELAARAEALGRVVGDRGIIERANRLLVRLNSTRPQRVEVRGPPPGAALAVVSGRAATLFSKAEALMTAYHKKRLRPRIELLQAAIRQKQSAMATAVRAYRSVIELGEAPATVAAEFRIGSLYNDLSISLMFDLPPELERSAASRIRRTLSSRAIADLRRARDAYRRSLQAAEGVGDRASVANWRAAAELGLRNVEDLLRGRE